MRLSFARIDAYRRCPFQYRVGWVERVPPPIRPYRRLANTLHLSLAAFHRLGLTEPSLDALLDAYRRAWGGPLTPYDREQQANGEVILREYVTKLGPAMPRTVYVEAPFEVPLGPHVVYGRLDRVDAASDGLEIVDYKTAEVPPEGEPPPDTLQLDVYQLGLQALSGQLARRVSFYYLRSNAKLTFERTEADARRTREWLAGIAHEVEADWRFEPRPGPACASCPYAVYCPAVAERPRPLPARKASGQLRLDI